MRSEMSTAIQVSGAAVLVFLLAGCRGAGGTAGLEDRLEKLPTLPPDIAVTLDPKTNATKIALSQPVPVKLPGLAPLAPCCASKDQKSLKVKVALTKCAPYRDFVLAPFSDLIMAREAPGGGGTGTPGATAGAPGSGSNVKAYKLNAVNRASIWDTIVCMTSDGPWDAIFEEDRNCNNYQPQDSLLVSGWGGLQSYYWNGGVANHPPQIQLVSCRDIGLFRFSCGGLSNCPCDSAPCPADQPCPCTLQW